MSSETLAEAKEMVKGKSEEKAGRGFRKAKPVDYFSPAEEEEKIKGKSEIIYYLKKVSNHCLYSYTLLMHVPFFVKIALRLTELNITMLLLVFSNIRKMYA